MLMPAAAVDSPNLSTVQGGFQGLNNRFLYSITSVPQVNLRNHTSPVLIGKTVGGSSAVNMMMTIRGTAEDYDRWGQLFSNSSSWSWAGLLPYFKKALNFVPPDEAVTKSAGITYNTAYWGNTSGVYAGWPSFQYPATTVVFNSYKGIPGVEFPDDSGSGKPGVYWYPTFMDPKLVTRSYARTGHYLNVKDKRPNYELVTNAKVNKILFDGTKATGITFVPTSGAARSATTVAARKEVILAAGAIHTPQILQLSGIGPAALLTSAKIPVLVDLPGVGQNFQDHPIVSATFQLRGLNVRPMQQELTSNREFRSWAEQVWAANRTGPYSIATGNAAAWLPLPVISKRAAELADRLEKQDHASYLPRNTHPTVSAGYKAQMLLLAAAMRRNDTAFYNAVISGGPANGIIVDLHPLSRGTVNIDPANPETREPIVDYRALANPVDVAVIADIIRFARRSHMENPMVNPTLRPTELAPGERVTSEEALASYIAETLNPSEYHPVGTAAMMPRELGGVVDENLRVYGVQNLRVVDGSMMPTLPGANTCQTVYAVAEKVSSPTFPAFVVLIY